MKLPAKLIGSIKNLMTNTEPELIPDVQKEEHLICLLLIVQFL